MWLQGYLWLVSTRNTSSTLYPPLNMLGQLNKWQLLPLSFGVYLNISIFIANTIACYIGPFKILA